MLYGFMTLPSLPLVCCLKLKRVFKPFSVFYSITFKNYYIYSTGSENFHCVFMLSTKRRWKELAMKRVKTFLGIFLVAFIISTSYSAEIRADESEVFEDDRYYIFMNSSSNYCMNNKHGDTYDGNHVNLYPLDVTDITTQLWKVSVTDYTPEGFPIVMISSFADNNKILDIRRYGKKLAPDKGQFSVLWTNDGSDTQKFILERVENSNTYEFRILTFVDRYVVSPSDSKKAETTQIPLTVNSYSTSVADYEKFILCDEEGNPISLSSVESKLKESELISEKLSELISSCDDSNCANSVYLVTQYISNYRKLYNKLLTDNSTKEEILYLKNEVAPVLSKFSREQMEKTKILSLNYPEINSEICNLINIVPSTDEIYEHSLYEIKRTNPTLYKLLTKYSEYSVVSNLRSSYLYDQHDFPRFVDSSGKNVGCTAVSESFALSLKTDCKYDPNSTYIGWNENGALWSTTEPIYCRSIDEYKRNLFNNINSGKAVIIRLKKNGISKHSVVAVGILDNLASYDELSFETILVYNPWDGQISRLSDLNYDAFDISWPLRVTKDELEFRKQ